MISEIVARDLDDGCSSVPTEPREAAEDEFGLCYTACNLIKGWANSSRIPTSPCF